MEEDDMYKTDGSFFGVPLEPLDQKLDRKKERAQTLSVLPILQSIIEQLEGDIAFYQSVKAIPDEVKADPAKFLIMHNANEMVADILLAKKEWVEGLIQNSKRR